MDSAGDILVSKGLAPLITRLSHWQFCLSIASVPFRSYERQRKTRCHRLRDGLTVTAIVSKKVSIVPPPFYRRIHAIPARSVRTPSAYF